MNELRVHLLYTIYFYMYCIITRCFVLFVCLYINTIKKKGIKEEQNKAFVCVCVFENELR